MNHTINVSFVTGIGQELVYADPNPSPGKGYMVKPGETVTWRITPETRELQVLFQEFVDLDPDGKPVNAPEPSNPMGPFSSLTVSAGLIFGLIRLDVPTEYPSRRFFYKLFEYGRPLNWANGLPGQPVDFGGGIDIPMTPPGPGTVTG